VAVLGRCLLKLTDRRRYSEPNRKPVPRAMSVCSIIKRSLLTTSI